MERSDKICILDRYKKREVKGLQPNEIPNHSQLSTVIMKTSTKVANISAWQNLSLQDLKGEVWVEIPFNPDYSISNYGRVKSNIRYRKNKDSFRVVKTRILKQKITKQGYLQITLRDSTNSYKSYLTHRLVGHVYLKNKNEYSQINHIDENKTNNSVENLEWCSASYNMNFGERAKNFSDSTSRKIVQKDKTGKIISVHKSIKHVASKLKYSKNSLYKCCSGKQESHKGFFWEYL